MHDAKSPLRGFLTSEVAGAIMLIVAAAVAVVWANSPWQAGYRRLWRTDLVVGLGHWDLALTLRDSVDEGLMSLFFFVVALEVRREFLDGELGSARQAVLPVVAALGGMIVPAVLFTLVNASGPGVDGWAIPMATDIAFAVGVLALVAPRLPSSLRVFLLALAIVDDIGAIVVIALFYSGPIDAGWLVVAMGVLAIVWLLGRLGRTTTAVLVALGLIAWLVFVAAGIHPTIAAVAMGLLVPATPELEHALQPWTTWIVLPIFALANAGVILTGQSLGDALSSPVTIGVCFGLLGGKVIGITGASWIACRAGLAELPSGADWRDLAGIGLLGGIGFTVSLFITELAFGESSLASNAKVGIFGAAIAATVLGALVLRRARR